MIKYANGCGSKGSTMKKLLPYRITLKCACDKHDICYYCVSIFKYISSAFTLICPKRKQITKNYHSVEHSCSLMRRSNCSAPSPHRGSPGVRRKMCLINKGAELKKEWLLCLYRAGQGKNKVIRRPGQPPKKWCPLGCPGEWGQNNLTGALLQKVKLKWCLW